MYTLKDMAQHNYNRGLWTLEMLNALVAKGKLTEQDVKEITSTK